MSAASHSVFKQRVMNNLSVPLLVPVRTDMTSDILLFRL